MRDAEELYRSILKIQPSHPEANHNLGVIAVQAQQPADGLAHLLAALEAEPTRGQYWLSYIDALFNSGQVESAREVLALAVLHGLSGDDVDAMKGHLNVGGEKVNQANISSRQELTQSPSVLSESAPFIGNGHQHISDESGLTLRYCPVCRNDQISFLPLPAFYRDQALQYGYMHFGKAEMTSLETYTCSYCGASDRERLYALWIDQQIEKGAFARNAHAIHFAPEAALSNCLLSQGFFAYKTADLLMADVDYKVDIMDIPIDNESFDFFICSHVLEHVDSDDQAIRELYRITKPGGCGILMAPIITGLQKTVEDPSVKDEAGRWRLFGQNDHVRLYAHDDFVQKIRDNGFHVEELGEAHFGEAIFRSLGLKRTSILYVVSK